jgi:hypothetical protein
MLFLREELEKENVDKHLKWKHVKKSLKKSSKYNLINSSSDREKLFDRVKSEIFAQKQEYV